MPPLRRLLPLGLGIALLASGCAATDTAARVGDERLSIAQLQQEVQALNGVRESPAPAGSDFSQEQRQLVQLHVFWALTDELAQREDITVPEAQVDAAVGTVPESITPEALELLRADFRARLLVEALQGQGVDVIAAFDRLEAEIGVEVNPRFGVWEGGGLQPGTGSISVPASPTG